MDAARKLRRELGNGIAKLQVLERSVDPIQDDESAKALAIQIREQAGVCLDLLDQYQLSVPGRMWAYTETRCRPLREDLRRRQLVSREASREFEDRSRVRRTSFDISDWWWRDACELDGDLGSAEFAPNDEEFETRETSPVTLSRGFIEAHNRQDLDGLIAFVDDDVEFKCAFDPPLSGKDAVRRQYERDWADDKVDLVTIREVFESEGKVAIEVEVDCGPSDLLFNGIVVHHWNDDGRLARYQLYVDEVA